jgi:ProQ/FINO family
MGRHPGRQRLIVRSFEPKPGRYAEKALAKAVAPVEAKSPPPAAKPVAPPKIRPPGPGADRKPGLTVAEQRRRKRAWLDALAWLKSAFPALFGYPPLPLAVGIGKAFAVQGREAGQRRDAIGAALHFHVNSHGYLKALAAPGAMRLRRGRRPGRGGRFAASSRSGDAAIEEIKAKRAAPIGSR